MTSLPESAYMPLCTRDSSSFVRTFVVSHLANIGHVRMLFDAKHRIESAVTSM